ncbi:hypothetical protein [Desulfitibacter alkalitolerans]|uniref:hypothetical protein n=1 Tax=Desulfitibacter alkalitolerans TaxID=264641 RepID=UPI000489BB64|nr:hypothetical protein [Desulfitibacter alkalitolerans]
MFLTKKLLREYQENMRAYIPEKLAQELLDTYGSYAVDNEGREVEYTEQDVYEQLRKRIRDYKG